MWIACYMTNYSYNIHTCNIFFFLLQSKFSSICLSQCNMNFRIRVTVFKATFNNIIPPLIEWGLYCNHLVCPSVRLSVHPFTLSSQISQLLLEKMILYLIYGFGMVTCTVPCLPFPGLSHIYFLFTVRLRIFHVCRNENIRNRYLSFYWKKWFYIWYVALAWWLVPCLPFPGLPHIYFLFTVRLTNERVGVFLARRSVQHLVLSSRTLTIFII